MKEQPGGLVCFEEKDISLALQNEGYKGSFSTDEVKTTIGYSVKSIMGHAKNNVANVAQIYRSFIRPPLAYCVHVGIPKKEK